LRLFQQATIQEGKKFRTETPTKEKGGRRKKKESWGSTIERPPAKGLLTDGDKRGEKKSSRRRGRNIINHKAKGIRTVKKGGRK